MVGFLPRDRSKIVEATLSLQNWHHSFNIQGENAFSSPNCTLFSRMSRGMQLHKIIKMSKSSVAGVGWYDPRNICHKLNYVSRSVFCTHARISLLSFAFVNTSTSRHSPTRPKQKKRKLCHSGTNKRVVRETSVSDEAEISPLKFQGPLKKLRKHATTSSKF